MCSSSDAEKTTSICHGVRSCCRQWESHKSSLDCSGIEDLYDAFHRGGIFEVSVGSSHCCIKKLRAHEGHVHPGLCTCSRVKNSADVLEERVATFVPSNVWPSSSSYLSLCDYWLWVDVEKVSNANNRIYFLIPIRRVFA